MNDPAQRLEHHLAKEFVEGYIRRALRRSRCVTINPNQVYWAARLAGLKISLSTLEHVLMELQKS